MAPKKISKIWSQKGLDCCNKLSHKGQRLGSQMLTFIPLFVKECPPPPQSRLPDINKTFSLYISGIWPSRSFSDCRDP